MENNVEEPVSTSQYYSLQQYWDIEESTAYKNEYHNGFLFIMDGASLNHNNIFTNLFGQLAYTIKNKGCKILGNRMRLNIPSVNGFVYPDAMIICNEIQLTEDELDTITNPDVIFEIISWETEANDCRKFFYYMQIPSVKEVVMINAFNRVKVEVGTKQDNGDWQITSYTSLQDNIILSTVNEQISLNTIYEEINF